LAVSRRTATSPRSGAKPVRTRKLYVGIAGWAIRPEHRALYAAGDSHLACYATRFNAVEINSCFYRPHRAATYARWAESVPADFRFALKIPRSISHELKLVDCCGPLDSFLADTAALGEKRGALLLQLPPKSAFDSEIARRFFSDLRERHNGKIACEPRHASWFGSEAEEMLIAHRIARVAADPAPVPGAERPGGWRDPVYYRLHGSPRMYYSRYGHEFLQGVSAALATAAEEAWCILDNTARGEATINGLELLRMLEAEGAMPRLMPGKHGVSPAEHLDTGCS
jgi:uncharacterized protein YecE (DUF72 family)